MHSLAAAPGYSRHTAKTTSVCCANDDSNTRLCYQDTASSSLSLITGSWSSQGGGDALVDATS